MFAMFLALNNLISGPRDHYSSQKAAFQPKRLLFSPSGLLFSLSTCSKVDLVLTILRPNPYVQNPKA